MPKQSQTDRGLGALNYHNTYKTFPPGYIGENPDPTDGQGWGWQRSCCRLWKARRSPRNCVRRQIPWESSPPIQFESACCRHHWPSISVPLTRQALARTSTAHYCPSPRSGQSPQPLVLQRLHSSTRGTRWETVSRSPSRTTLLHLATVGTRLLADRATPRQRCVWM